MLVIGASLFVIDFLKSCFSVTKTLNLTSLWQKLAVQTIVFDALIFSIMIKECEQSLINGRTIGFSQTAHLFKKYHRETDKRSRYV